MTATAIGKVTFGDWIGLIESKLRFLILNLERNPYIQIVHVNPEQFIYDPDKDASKIVPMTEQNEMGEMVPAEGYFEPTYQCRWFIGLTFQVLQQTQSSSVNLTDNIQAFQQTVWTHRNRQNSNPVNIKWMLFFKKDGEIL